MIFSHACISGVESNKAFKRDENIKDAGNKFIGVQSVRSENNQAGAYRDVVQISRELKRLMEFWARVEVAH